MIIKKYHGKTESDALSLAQKELGDCVVLMNSKEIKQKGLMRLFKSSYFEVTVAKEEENSVSERSYEKKKEESPKEDTKEKATFLMEEKKIEERLSSLEVMLEKQMSKSEKANEESKADAVAKEKEAGKEESSTELSNTFAMVTSMLKENEVDEQYISSILDEVKKGLKEDALMEQILSNIYQRMILRFGKAEKIVPAKEGVKILFFVGTTGVGKTTTIAKIASQFVVEDKKKVALLTADTFRIAAAEQLRTYANILEIPFRVIYTTEEIIEAVENFKEFDYILVDTAGHSQYNDTQRETMTEYVESIRAKAETEVFLVLAANTKYKDMLSIADSYKKMTEYKLIFTKMDETDTYGNLLNLKLYTGAEMSYITCGQNVPDDIASFDAQSIVKKLLGGK
ncbi:MAG: flagellar biosynthesis protein FlhF [Lachnospiraceae bacterium]|nr:flagellar biosynthesis protein FlhF [Lachnospiraceae bacterium]